MYKIIYKYNGNRKSAFVCASSAENARQILLAQFLVGAITIESTIKVVEGSVIYPDGRF